MHGITDIDKGYIGNVDSVWHKLPQFKCLPDRMVSIIEALEVSNYPMEKRQLMRVNSDGKCVPANVWEIVRTDFDTVLAPSVGERFTVNDDNKRMVNRINEGLLALYPELQIESAITLFGGATFIMSMKVNEFTIKGDNSPTQTSLAYVNPIGRGSFMAFCHSTRIVCNNTARVAEAQGVANKSLRKFRHTASATNKIDAHLIDLAELKLELKRHEDKMNFLSDCPMNTEQVDAFLNKLFPAVNDDKEGRSKTIALNSKAEVLNIFEGVQTQTLSVPFSKYGMFQSLTDWIDHEKTSRNSDIGATMYDGLVGQRADKKDAFLDALIAA